MGDLLLHSQQSEPLTLESGVNEVVEHLEQNAGASAYYAFTEMHYGRLDWLAEHIRCSHFQIDPIVARKLLAMLEGEDSSMFRLVAVRKEGIPSAGRDPQLLEFRDVDLALEVARQGGFSRGGMARVSHEVGKRFGLSAPYVAARIRRHKRLALEVIAEERAKILHREFVDFDEPKSS